jgi:hypothetical protein
VKDFLRFPGLLEHVSHQKETNGADNSAASDPKGLGARSQLQWIVDAYAIVFAGLLLSMGELGGSARQEVACYGRSAGVRRRLDPRCPVGSPETVARKIAANVTIQGVALKCGLPGLSHEALVRNIELYGTRVSNGSANCWDNDPNAGESQVVPTARGSLNRAGLMSLARLE